MRYQTKLIIPALIAVMACVPAAASAASVPLASRLEELQSQGMEVTYDVVTEEADGTNPTSQRPVIYVSIVKNGQSRWVAEQVSFAPIERATPQHEVLRFTSDGRLSVSPAFEMDVPLTSTATPPIDNAIFSCGSFGRMEAMRERAGRYTMCSTKFTRTSALATGGMLLLAGPLGAGNYRLYSRGPVAEAVLETGIVPLIKSLVPALEAARAASTKKPADTFGALTDVITQRAKIGMGTRVGPAYRDNVINYILLDLNGQIAQMRDTMAGEFKLDLSGFAQIYRIEAGGTAPQAVAALTALTASPTRQTSLTEARLRAEAVLDATYIRLGCTDPTSERGRGMFATPHWELRYKLACPAFSAWPKSQVASSNLTSPIPQPVIWAVPLAESYFFPIKIMKDFTLSDANVGATVTQANGLMFENKTDSFITIKSVSFYVGDTITTHALEGSSGSLPPLATGEFADIARRTGGDRLLAALASQPIPLSTQVEANYRTTGPTPFATTMGFAILYEVNGQQKTLLKRASFPVITAAEVAR